MSHTNDNTEKALEPGIVISYFGNSVAVESGSGQVFQCHLHRNQALPLVGDHVLWLRDQDDTGTIDRIVDRKSVLARADRYGKLKPIVANIDLLVIVMAPPPIFAEYLVDRYCIAAEILKLQPVVILNKIDLLSAAAKKSALARLKPYQQLAYPVMTTSIVARGGLKKFTDLMQGKSGVLVGPSGVGKSSIIAKLTKQDIRVGDVSVKGAGKHTTTATRYYHLPAGGSLIDSPGVREFSLWAVTKEEIQQGFSEFRAFLGQCRFRDCQHLVEPGCTIQDAVKANKISEQRYLSYQTLIKNVRSSGKE